MCAGRISTFIQSEQSVMTTKSSSESNPAIGILGTGRMGVRLAAMFARAGRPVVLGSRDPARAQRIVSGLEISGITAGSYERAVAAPAILPAAFIRDGLFELLENFRDDLNDKLVIDITNPFNDTYTDFILPWHTSGAEALQERFPRARIVGAFKNVWWETFDAPYFEGGLSDVFVVSDHEAEKRSFFDLVKGTPFRYIDAGGLKNARTVERMTLMLGELGQRYEYFPRMNWRVLGEPWQMGSADKDGIGNLIAR
jgi:predicted dinucleotide-binding enzyme